MNPIGRPERFLEIDSLRGIAALWVVLFHFTYGVGARFLPTSPDLAARIVPCFFNTEGLLAVDLFFMISGFVISMTLERSSSVADFAVSRFSRLYPAYWACLTLSTATILLLPVAGQTISSRQIAAGATMANAFLGFDPVETAYWSLALELAFYAIMAGIFRLGLLPRIEWLGAIWLAVSALGFTFYPALGAMLPWRVQTALVLPYAPLFFAGIIVYRARTEGWTPLRIVLLTACVFVRLSTFRYFPSLIGTAAIFAVFIATFLGWMRFLRWRPLILLGGVSYPLYLVHGSIGYRVQYWATIDLGLSAIAGLIVALAAVVLLATAISVFVERPVQRWLRDAYRRRKPRFAMIAGVPHTAVKAANSPGGPSP